MIKIETVHWHTFSPRYLGPDSKVLDLGANYGLFSKEINRRCGCYCVAVEPSPSPFEGISTSPRISKIAVAVAGRPGSMQFQINQNSLASSLVRDYGESTIEVRVVSLPELLDALRWPIIDLLKVDVEGAEIEMLASYSDQFLSKRIAQISIEFHDFCGITPPADVRKNA